MNVHDVDADDDGDHDVATDVDHAHDADNDEYDDTVVYCKCTVLYCSLL